MKEELKQNNKYDNNFTMIHIVAAVMVIIGHQFVLIGGEASQIMGVSIHELGVKILFLVSGYLVSASFLRSKNVIKYITKRLARIYPPLFFCLIITVLFMRIMTNSPEFYWESAFSYVLNNLAMRPTFGIAGVFLDNPHASTVNGSLWTLPIELILYFLLILYMKLIFWVDGHIARAKFFFSGAILLILSWVDVCYVNLNGKSIPSIWTVDLTAGVILAIYFFIGVSFQILELKKLCNWQNALMAVVLWECCPSLFQNAVAPYLTSYIVMCFALAENPLYCNLFKHDICYGMYLYAFPVQQVVIWLFWVKLKVDFPVYALLLISLIVTILLARIQYWMIEERGITLFLIKSVKGTGNKR